MKSKRLLQIFVLLTLVFSPFGNVSASMSPAYNLNPMVTQRGSHYREIVVGQPTVTTSVNPSSIGIGENATVTVDLNDVPEEGFTSAEFTCTFNTSLVEVGSTLMSDLFGEDAAVAINDLQNGSFILAIAGSNGRKATTGGSVFTFSATGLQSGQTAIECAARVSKGDNVLNSIFATGTSLTVAAAAPTFTPTAFDTPTPTSTTPVETPTPTSSTPVDTATPTSSTPEDTVTPTATQSTPTETSTPVESATPTFTSTPFESPTPTPLPNGSLNGQVLAGKPVTVSLYDASTTLVTSATANPDGTFSLTAPVGTYNVIATASGFLSAQGSAIITGGSTNTKPTITLLAGDIDGNNVIDQFDALTIGMNYNATTPPAADLNNDGVINVLDLEVLAENYRATGPSAWEISYP